METENSDEAKAVLKILQDTQNGVIRWSIMDGRLNLTKNEYLLGNVYFTKYNERILTLYMYEFEDAFLYKSRGMSYRLNLADENFETMWTFPWLNSLSDLYQVVIYNTAKVDEFIKTVLNKKK